MATNVEEAVRRINAQIVHLFHEVIEDRLEKRMARSAIHTYQELLLELFEGATSTGVEHADHRALLLQRFILGDVSVTHQHRDPNADLPESLTGIPFHEIS